ncbi:DNA glycosylase AlkZ-like family protein [Conexibacter arvalis]|uniref:Winged helix DNA-binding domain-containing protein n=1 Tax=Conexibacter arvalis TaxID=912552 RepID=A0A840IFU2_9ACTN|nr:crosslink repair DNA glycosylase YcaQ family protein [Conexibacter arvalis]MBB4663689.1 hypothetical protein [Conexibacter arvalis]
MSFSSGQIVAFRLAAQGLVGPAREPLDALAGGWAFQDSPPGAAAAALSARCDELSVGWLDAALHDDRTVVALYNPRTATALVPAGDVATFTAGLMPADEASWRFLLGRAIPPAGEGVGPAAALDVALPAFEAALDGGPLSRDDLHAELRERLPDELLPWCDGCQSHHARRGLLVAASLHGRLCIAGRAGRQPLFARTDRWLGPQAAPEAVNRDEAAAEVVRRHLRWYGPTTPARFAQWAGIAPAQALRAWALVAGELEAIELEGGGTAWLLAADRDALEAAGAGGTGAGSADAGGAGPRGAGPRGAGPRGAGAGGVGAGGVGAGGAQAGADAGAPRVRLLPAGDPLLLARDRELLVSDAGTRRRIWAAINGPGVALVDGRPAALWRARKRGRRLAVELTALDGALPAATVAAAEREARRLAPHRGCATAEIAAA